jgi:Tol biopolymer transport system component
MEPDGSNVRDLTTGVGPAWSADGRRIVFSRSPRTGRNSDLYVMRADGSHVRRLTFTRYRSEGAPAFSPDGSKIVFSTIVGIFVMRLDDLRTRFLTDGGGAQWGPNGRRIVFEDQRDGAAGLATIRPDGTHQRRLTTPQNGFDAYPAYAPGGRTIYFDRFTLRGPVVLMRVGAFGGHVQRLPTPISGAGLYSPAPAPAGGCVVGAGTRGASQELYARGGRCPAQGWLDQEGDLPSWQPLP